MQIVYDESGLLEYMGSAVKASPKHPVLIDKYLSDAIEVDADAISDGTNVVVAGIMEHIEEAGVHSGDSACSLPPYSLDQKVVEEIRRQMKALALELGVIGLIGMFDRLGSNTSVENLAPELAISLQCTLFGAILASVYMSAASRFDQRIKALEYDYDILAHSLEVRVQNDAEIEVEA